MALNLLDANDRAGAYPQSWYAATATALPQQQSLKGAVDADVCIVGAGFTGLSAALHLAKAGQRVVVLEAQRIGFGASGRNGGQLGSGQRNDQHTLEKLMGLDKAKLLWTLAEDTKRTVKSLIDSYKIECHLKPGIAHLGLNPSEMQDLHDEADHLATTYDYDKIKTLDKEQGHELCRSPIYHGGYIDHDAAHLHPLRFAFGLAKAALLEGATIFENTRVLKIERGVRPRVETADGHVDCDHVILAANGYLGDLVPEVSRRVMPINNYIVATQPLGAQAQDILSQDIAVADTKFVVNYFRLSHDKRLLFGGTESYGYRFPTNIADKVRKPMSHIFPQLADVPIDFAWGGTLGITMRRMPYLARVTDNIFNASGYSGHGVGAATHAGKLVAMAIQGQAEGFDLQGSVPALPFPGGHRLRHPLLVLGMTWYALRDRLGV